MEHVPLTAGIDGRRSAWLAPMTGAAEVAAAVGPLPLLRSCLADGREGAISPSEVGDLPLVDRDRLLAAIHRDAFGDWLEADGACGACGGAYAMAFSLEALIESQRPTLPDSVVGPDARSRYRLGETVFRLPSSRDLAAARSAERPDRALLAACVCVGDPTGKEAEIEAAMAAAGPLLDLDLAAHCPDCGAAQTPRFQIDVFLRQCFEAERPLRLREVHLIASAYRWSHASILALTRRDRHGFVELIRERPSRATPIDQLAARTGTVG